MRRWVGNLLAVAVSIAVTMVACEIGLRMFWKGYYLKLDQGYAEDHPTRGWHNRPDADVPYGEPEFVTQVTHNHLGFRGPEIGPKDPSRVRVLMLGDSFTYGVGVENDETFSARLQALDPSLEVINTGVNGYGTSQELLVLREDGLPLQPDIVMVAFFWNDFVNSYRSRFASFELQDGKLVQLPGKPVTDAEKAGREPNRPWLRYSYLYRFASDRIKLVRYRVRVMLGQPVADGHIMTPEDREKANAVTFALLAEIDRLTREAGGHMLLLSLPEEVQVQPDAAVMGLDPAEYEVQDRLATFAAEAKIPFLDLLPVLRDAYARDHVPLYYPQDRHFRANAHALVAARIRDELAKLGWLRAPRS